MFNVLGDFEMFEMNLFIDLLLVYVTLKSGVLSRKNNVGENGALLRNKDCN